MTFNCNYSVAYLEKASHCPELAGKVQWVASTFTEKSRRVNSTLRTSMTTILFVMAKALPISTERPAHDRTILQPGY